MIVLDLNIFWKNNYHENKEIRYSSEKLYWKTKQYIFELHFDLRPHVTDQPAPWNF